MKHSPVFVLTALMLMAFPAIGQKKKDTAYFPAPGEWQRRAPSTVGMSESLLKEAVAYAVENTTKADPDLKVAHYQSAFGREPFGYPIGPMKTRGEASGLIIKNGYIVAEWGNLDRVDLTFSVAKSVLSTVAGLAYDQRLFRSVEDLVHPYMAPIIPYHPLPLLQNKADHLGQDDVFELFDTPHNREIRWEHLLRQSSDWEGTLWGKPDWADRPDRNSQEWMTRERHEPGTVYKYNDTRVNVLALALLNLWRQPLPIVAKEQLFDKIGASPTWRWTGYENSWVVLDGLPVQSVSGGSHWGGGLFINAYDQARFAYLTLRNGRWNHHQVVSEEWIRLSKTPGPANSGYGFMNYFLNTDQKLYPSAPASAFAHLGAGTNFLYVDPENDLIIVARWIDNAALDGLIERVLKSKM
jgi:hypothetical protein